MIFWRHWTWPSLNLADIYKILQKFDISWFEFFQKCHIGTADAIIVIFMVDDYEYLIYFLIFWRFFVILANFWLIFGLILAKIMEIYPEISENEVYANVLVSRHPEWLRMVIVDWKWYPTILINQFWGVRSPSECKIGQILAKIVEI